MRSARLIIDPPLRGAVNMARDEALLLACADVAFQPVLRFYAWKPAAISLGYFQDFTEFESIDAPARDLDVVRRTTGGGAILHDIEVTYSMTFPVDHPLIHRRPNDLYELAHDAVIEAIGGGVRLYKCGESGRSACGEPLSSESSACGGSSQRGPFFCFARRHGLDVVIDDSDDPQGTSKIAGSAQRRTKTAVLQHGSIILERRYEQQPAAAWRSIDPQITDEEAIEKLAAAFSRSLDMELLPSDWRDSELEAAGAYEGRYGGEAWTRDRIRG